MTTPGVRIRAAMEQHILSGDWPPGHHLPSETVVAAQYGCSRMTANKVLSGLAAAGLITRRRRTGSVVAAPRAERAMMEIGDFARDTAQLGQTYRYEILSRGLERGPDGDELLRVTCRHWADDVPLAHEDRVILLDTVPAAREEIFADLPPGTWLLAGLHWTQAEHVIRASNADAAMAATLDIPPGAACLILDRRTWHGGALVTEVRLTYPGDRHHFVGRFSPIPS